MEVWEYRAEFPAPLPVLVSVAVRQDGRGATADMFLMLASQN